MKKKNKYLDFTGSSEFADTNNLEKRVLNNRKNKLNIQYRELFKDSNDLHSIKEKPLKTNPLDDSDLERKKQDALKKFLEKK